MVIFNSYVSLPEGTSLRKQTYCSVRVYVPLGLLVGQCLPWAARISNFHSNNVLVTILRESNMANMAFKKLHHLQSSIYTGFPRQTCLNAYGYNKQWGRSLIIQMWQMVAANLKPEVDQTQHSRKNDWSIIDHYFSWDFIWFHASPPKKGGAFQPISSQNPHLLPGCGDLKHHRAKRNVGNVGDDLMVSLKKNMI